MTDSAGRQVRVRTRRASFALGAGSALLFATALYVGSEAIAVLRQPALPVFSNRIDLARIMRTDPDTFWTLAANLDAVEMKPQDGGDQRPFHVTTNRLGLRSPEVGVKSGRLRVLAIGDSTTFGQYVEDAEAWPAQVQAMIDPGSEHLEMINAGCIGMTSFQGLSYLIHRGFALEPDVVIATYGFNDRAQWNWSDRGFSQGLAGSLLKPWFGGGAPAADVQATRVSAGEFLDVLLEMKRLCQERNIELFYLCWPTPDQIAGPWDALPSNTYHSLMFEAAQRSGARMIDVRRALHEAPQPVFVDVVHANAAGCRVVAGVVAETLRGLYPQLAAPPPAAAS